jgi:hypothetical protein
MPRSPKWHLSLRFPNQNPVRISPLFHTCYMSCLLILLDFITWKIFSEDCQSRRSSFIHLRQSPVMSSHLDPTQVQISSSVPYS